MLSLNYQIIYYQIIYISNFVKVVIMKNQRYVTVRISDELLEKLYYTAKSEGRTLNNQFLLMARNSVAYFERTKGKIDSAKLSEIRTELQNELENGIEK
jgi:hypothetical protein